MVPSISKSTSLGRLGGTSSRQFSSSTSSLKSHSNPNHSQLTPSAKDAAHKSLKQDSLLRDAISLYHLSPSFYPVPSSDTSSSSAGAAISLSLTSRINSDFLSRFIPSSDSSSSYSYPKSTQSARGGGGGETTGNFKFQFPTISTLQNRQDSLQNRNVKDGYIFNSDGKALGSNSRKSNDDEIKALFNTRSSPSSSSSSSTSSSPSTLSSRKGLNSTYQLTSIPSISKGSGDRIITSPSLVAGSTSQNLASKDGNGLGLNNLDERGARIRDALFGTVSGGLPGLEIVRERKERRIRRLKEEGGEEEE